MIIVEDILDSGVTLSYLTKYLEGRAPASISLVTLLDKPARRRADVRATTSASSPRTRSSWATASTTRSSTATCRISAFSSPRSTKKRANKEARAARRK